MTPSPSPADRSPRAVIRLFPPRDRGVILGGQPQHGGGSPSASGKVLVVNRTPVVLVHGAWFHGSSWENWAERLTSHGFVVHVPGRPVHRDWGLEALVEHCESFVRSLDSRPVLIGHSLGGLVVQHLLGVGLGRAAVALAPWPGDGVPTAELQTLVWSPVADASARLSRSSFRDSIANTVAEAEADRLFERHVVPAPRRLLADLGFDPDGDRGGACTPARIVVDTADAARGPLLLVSGQEDRVIPDAVTRAAYKAYGDTVAVTDLKQFADRGHSLVIDSGWSVIADHVLVWLAANGIAAVTAES